MVRHFYHLSARRTGASEAPWRIATVGYTHELVDRHHVRVIAFHHHPPGDQGIDYPHLHVGRQFAHRALPADVRARADRLVRSHLPTGPIALPPVLRYAITELGVLPLRDDWRAVLDETERATRPFLDER